jgi:hypothetical protein
MKKIDREHWLKGIATAKRSQDRGKLQAAVTRLERVQRQIEKKLQVSVVSRCFISKSLSVGTTKELSL